jgi:hypothetical protein
VFNKPVSSTDPTGLAEYQGKDGVWRWEWLTSKDDKITICEQIHNEYDDLWKIYRNFGTERDKDKLKAMCDAINKEIALRQKYLELGCDYILPGSIGNGSKDSERTHKDQLDSKKTAAESCRRRYFKMCAKTQK